MQKVIGLRENLSFLGLMVVPLTLFFYLTLNEIRIGQNILKEPLLLQSEPNSTYGTIAFWIENPTAYFISEFVGKVKELTLLENRIKTLSAQDAHQALRVDINRPDFTTIGALQASAISVKIEAPKKEISQILKAKFLKRKNCLS